jgi:hypothetical protein
MGSPNQVAQSDRPLLHRRQLRVLGAKRHHNIEQVSGILVTLQAQQALCDGQRVRRLEGVEHIQCPIG